MGQSKQKIDHQTEDSVYLNIFLMFILRCFIQTDCESEWQCVERFDAIISPPPP